jgi:hypothetical protein
MEAKMPEFLEYDPDTGVRYEVAEQDGLEFMTRKQDLQRLVDRNREIANRGLADGGIKQNWWHVADIPTTIWLEMKTLGYDIFARDDAEFWRAMRYFRETYPNLCTTNKKWA